MENNEIMKRLMQDSKQNKSSEKESETTTKANNDTAVSKIRIVTAKYKVYIVLILIFICFMCFDFIPDAQDAYKSSQNSLEQVNNEFARVNRDLDDAKKDVKYLRNIVENEGNLKDHLDEEYQLMIKKNNGDYPEEDEEVDCSRLPEDWVT
jgi:cell division protein FtsL